MAIYRELSGMPQCLIEKISKNIVKEGGMRIFYCILISFLVNSFVYPQSSHLFWNGTRIDINGHSFTFSDERRVEGIKNGNPENGMHNGFYQIIEQDGITYLSILWDDYTQDLYLMIAQSYSIYDDNDNNIYYDAINLYNGDGFPFFNMGTIPTNSGRFRNGRLLVDTEIISVSSILSGTDRIYSTEYLNEEIGVNLIFEENGIGNIIVFNKDFIGGGFQSLYISSGFISFERPYLYRQYSRAKTLRVSFEGDRETIIQLTDTPNLQYIIDFWPSGRDLWIEILDVYQGILYNNTCINFFGWDWSQ